MSADLRFADPRNADDRFADDPATPRTPLPVPVPRQRRAEETSPVGAASLTQPNARSNRLCDACGDERLTEIEMTLTDGTGALFCSCHGCERKSWQAKGPGTLLDLTFDAVLDRTRKIR